MDYKEKYENGVECIQEILGGAGDSIKVSILRKRLQPFFPELRESEDEKIRKELCDFLRDNMLHQDAQYFISWLERQKDYIKFPNSAYTSNKDVIEFADKYSHAVWENLMYNFKKVENCFIGCNDVSDIVLNAIINTYNWLEGQGDKKHIFNADDWYVSEVDGKIHNAKFIEKQDGEKPADKIEPKFKVGDWFVNNNRKDVFLIKSIDANGYCTLEDIKGNIIFPCLPPCESDSHIWTIEDAKDGDVLTNGEFIVIFKQIIEPKYRQHIEAYIGLDLGGNIQITSESWSLGIDKAMPATKEQRGLLFQKMKEAGCEWDSTYKKLAIL